MLTKKVQGWLGSPGAPAPQISLAAFGKHPGWDDHIEDLGLENEALIQARRVLYSEGLGGNIESGAWDKLEEHQRLAGFGHIAIWRRGSDLLIARIWSSSDGKGRTRYPMVLCAHCAGIPMSWAISEVLPRLEKAQMRCEQTPKAGDVREIVQATRLKLRTALKGSLRELTSWTGDDVVQDRELARLAESPQLQAYKTEPGSPPPPPRAGLLRILYQVEREMGAFIAGSGKDRKSAMANVRPQQIRVPACGVAPGEAGRLWTGVLLETLADGVGIMTIQAVDQRWLDVIVGDPGTANLFCMRASDKMIPLTSDIPYTLDADFIGRAQVMIDAWSGKLPKPKTGPSPVPPSPAADAAPAAAAPAPAPAPGPAPAPPPAPAPAFPAEAPVTQRPAALAGQATLPPSLGSPPSTSIAIGQPQRAMPIWMLLLVAAVVIIAAIITLLALRGSVDPLLPTPDDASAASSDNPPPVPGPGPAGTRPPPPPPAPQPGADQPAPGSLPAPPVANPADAGPGHGQPPSAAASGPPTPAPPEPPQPVTASPTPTPTPAPIAKPATAITVTASVLERAVAAGVGLDDPVVPGGPTLGEAAARLDSGAGSPALSAGVQRLRQIKEMDDRAGLEAIVRAASAQTAFEAFAAWRRLVELGWPDRRDELNAFPEARARVLTLAEGVSDGVRRPALRREFAASARRAVTAALEVCGAETDAEWQAALSVAEGAGVSRADLGPVARFNTLFMEVRIEVAAAGDGTDDAAARQRVMTFVGQAEGFDAAVRGRIAALVGELQALLAAGPAEAAVGGDAAKAGPGGAGWMLAAGSGPDRLIYEVAEGRPGEAGPDRLEFAPVPGTGAYLSRQEVSVGLALRTIQRKGGWTDVRKARLLRMFDPAVNDPRPGPRVWEWSIKRPGEAEVASQWLWPGPADARVKVKSEAPPDAAPMQHISVDAMVYIAGLLGCRLPTLDEWRRAVAAERAEAGPGAVAPAPNLRDAAWKQQWQLVNAKQGRADAPAWPDRGAFKPADMTIPLLERAVPATEADDGVVWFTPVEAGPGRVFRNLIGNVAEVVLLDARLAEGFDAGRPDQIRDRLGDRSGIRVVGGSALSAVDLGVDRDWPVEMTPSREGWADVGFRLAMAGPPGLAGSGAAARPGEGEGVWRRAASAMAKAGYLGRE